MQICTVGFFGRQVDGKNNIQFLDFIAPVSDETGAFFGQIADQAFKQLCASDEKQNGKRDNGQDAGRQEAAKQGADTAGGSDEDCRNAGQKKEGENGNMHFFRAIGKSRRQGVKRNRSQKEKQGGNSVGHGNAPHCEFIILYGNREGC